MPSASGRRTNRVWDRDRGWRDWPQLFGRLDDLPPAPDGPGGDVDRMARRAVSVLVRELNELLDPIVDQLENTMGERGPTTQ